MSASSTARRIAATALAAGAIVSAVALPAAAHDHDDHRRAPKVEISKVQADSPGRDNRSNRSLNAEWVELTNNTRHAINLKGWVLKDEDGHRYRFDNFRLNGRSTVRIHTGEGRDTRTDLYQDRRNYVWDNHSDKATLKDARGHVVDTESWGRHHHRR